MHAAAGLPRGLRPLHRDPLLQREACVERVCADLHAALQRAGLHFEIVAVQNGSWDRTGAILESLKSRYSPLRVVVVPVNQGYGYGLRQGLAAALAPWLASARGLP